MTLREQLEKAKADRAARLAAAEAARIEPEVSTLRAESPKTEYRPKNLSVEVDADQIIPEIVSSLKELPETLAMALESLPELKAVVEEAAATADGLMGALEKRYAPLARRQERRKKIAAFKKRIADLLTERLPYGLAQELIAFDALVEITSAKNNEIQAANKAARDTKGKMTFVRQSLEKNKGGAVVATHYYLETEEWLADAFRAHHVALKRSEKTWTNHLVKLGVDSAADSKDALLRIAMGEKIAAVAYLPYDRRLNIDGREVFGKYLVEGIDPDGNVPQMIFTELEGDESLDEAESPMYFATRGLAGGVFQFKPLLDKGRTYLAFAGLQEKSGKPFGLAKKLLMSSLGVEERKRDDRPFGQHASSGSKRTFTITTDGYKSGAGSARIKTTPVQLKVAPVVDDEETQKPTRKVRRAQQQTTQTTHISEDGENPVGKTEKKPGGAKNSTRQALDLAEQQ